MRRFRLPLSEAGWSEAYQRRLNAEIERHLDQLGVLAGQGGTAGPPGSTSPLTTKGDLWGYSTLDARVPVGTNGTILTADSAQALGVKWDAVPITTNSFGATFGDGYSADSIVDGLIGYVTVPYGGTIVRGQIVADVGCTCTVEVWKLNGGIPTVANKISATAPLSLTSDTFNEDTTLAGWTTTAAVGDVFAFKLNLSSGSPKQILVQLGLVAGEVSVPTGNSVGTQFGDGTYTSSVVSGQISYVTVPYGGEIVRAQILSDVSCSLNVEVWKANGAIPTVANIISGGSPVALSSQTYAVDTTLTGWTKSVSAGDVFAFKLNKTSGSPKQVIVQLGISGRAVSGVALTDMIDVTITSPVSGNVLAYNGAEWVNTPAAAGSLSDLNSLSDVVISAPSASQILKYNGTNWVNDAATGSTFSGAKARRTTTQAVANNSSALITWALEDFDTDSYFTIGSTTMTIPNTGYYLVTSSVQWEANNAGTRAIALILNGSTIIAKDSCYTGNAFEQANSVTCVYYFTGGDTVGVRAYVDAAGGSRNITPQNNGTFLSIVRLG